MSGRRKKGTATIRDVARQAGVSIATVSRVLNNPAKVRERTRQRVEKVMRAVAFQRNVFAAALVTNRSETIGLAVPHLTDVFFVPMISEIGKTVASHGSYMMVTCSGYSADEVERNIRFLQQRRCDAIIAFPGAMADAHLLALMAEIPHMVVIHRLLKRHADRCVLVDNRLGARLAARYLIDCGHRDIAVITGPSVNMESAERLATFVETMREAGLAVDPDLVAEGDFLLESGADSVARLLATAKPFTAVFCLNDRMAMGALSYLQSTGVSVPEEISLMGFDDTDYASLVYPRLTTIRQEVVELGRTAAEIALSMGGRDVAPPRRTILPPRLIVRDSVAPLGAGGSRRGVRRPAAAAPIIE
jgi:LacI family transcriptional regulator, galactose operon repressor